MGTAFLSVYYNNRIGGSWNGSGIEIQGATGEKRCQNPDILIDDDNLPCIAYVNITDNDARAAQGNANDATSFTLSDVETSVEVGTGRGVGICVDSNGDHWVATRLNADAVIYIIQHIKADAWTTWQTRVGDGDIGRDATIFADGTDIYAVYENSSNDIVYNKYTGTWAGEVVLEDAASDESVKPQWARYVDYDSGGTNRAGAGGRLELSYAWLAGSDIRWNKLDIAVGGLPIPVAMNQYRRQHQGVF